MIILNACKDIKLEFNDDTHHLLFSPRIVSKSSVSKMCVVQDILIEREMDQFLSDKKFSWIWSEDKSQIYGLSVEAEKDVCHAFLKDFLTVDGEVLLDDEESAF
jgi:hypothetical protein